MALSCGSARPCFGLDEQGIDALYSQLESPDPRSALAAFDRLITIHARDTAELWPTLERRGDLWDLFEQGVGGLEEDRRSEAVLALAEMASRRLEEGLEDLRTVGALAWALDAFPGRDPALGERARTVRDRVLARLRRRTAPDPSSFQWVPVRAGSFTMGGAVGDADEQPAHDVALRSFRMLAHEVTNEQFRRLVPGHGTPPDDDLLPAVNVTWYQAYAFSAWLGGRLPTEAEWEYAARAGTTTRYWSGDEEEDLERIGWYAGNAQRRPHRVAEKPPSPWGLYDMHGGAWEWVADWYGEYPAGPQENPWGPPGGRERVFRGGSFWDDAPLARAANRNWARPQFGFVYLGFRVVLPAAPGPDPGSFEPNGDHSSRGRLATYLR